MTQNGQGEEPSPRPAREGIVLPSDGSAPLLPGTPPDHTTPAGGQSWDQPWGPGRPPQAPPGQDQDQGWQDPAQDGNTPAPSWGTPSDPTSGWTGDQGSEYGAQGSATAPQYGQYGTQGADAPPQWGAPSVPSGEGHQPPPANAPAPQPHQSPETGGLPRRA